MGNRKVDEPGDDVLLSRRNFFRFAGAAVLSYAVSRNPEEDVTEVSGEDCGCRDHMSLPEDGETLGGMRQCESNLTETAIMSYLYMLDRPHEDFAFLDNDRRIIGGHVFGAPSDNDFRRCHSRKKSATANCETLSEWTRRIRTTLHEEYPHIPFNVDAENTRDWKPILSRGSMGLDRAIDNSVKPAGDGSGKSVLQVVEEEFPKAFKETDFAKTYPMEAVDIMDFFMHGLAAQESKYNRFALSEDGALGVWQFMPITARAMGLKAGGYTDERTDVKKSTRAAAKYIDRIYYRLIKNSPILEVMRKFGVSAEDFIVPCIMNSYHSGPTNVYKMISWFSEAHTPESFAEEFGTGPYGKDLYFLMSKLYVESGQSGNYKKHSREYYLRVMAMYVGVKAKLSDPNADIGTISGYEAPSNGAVPDEAKDAGRSLKAQSDCQSVHSIDRQSNGKWVETAIYGLAVPAALAMVLAGIRSKCGGVVKRRHFIMYPVAISLGALLNRFNKDVRTHTVDLEKDVFRPECNVPIEGLDGADAMAELDAYMDKEYTYDKSLVSDFLEIAGKGPKVPTLTTPEFTSLSPANTAHNAAVSIAYAKKQGLAKFASEDDIKHRIKADKYSASGELIQLPGNGYKFRLRGIGQTGSSARNNPLYAYTYPSSQNVLNGISLELNRELQAAGFPAGLYARPIITGASRTDEFQKKLQKGNSNAVDDTPHKYLNAFDISYARFDVLDPQTGRFYMVAKGDELDRKFNLLRKYDSALGRIMLTLMGERIENSKRLSEPAQVFDRPIVRCRRETNQACYHFSTETGLEGTK